MVSRLNGVQESGTDAIGVEFRQIGGKLWELKIQVHGHKHRIFYVVLTGNVMVLLHAFLKKTPKTPQKEIEVAKERMKTVIGGIK